MDFKKNYYAILGVGKDSTEKDIKKTYYKLSFSHHPDKGGDALVFAEITEAYNVLSENREEYDFRSKYGAKYDESSELLDYEFDQYKKGWNENKYEDWKKSNVLNVIVYVDPDTFKGTVEYERYVTCKSCSGSGKDLDSKIQIKDENGNVLKIFEGTDGCDFCEGTGKNWMGNDCNFCGGKGKVGSEDCKVCNGERRILGKQKLKGIKIKKKEKSTKIDFMGHVSKEDKDIYGNLWVVKS